jgi:hypothetical protein
MLSTSASSQCGYYSGVIYLPLCRLMAMQAREQRRPALWAGPRDYGKDPATPDDGFLLPTFDGSWRGAKSHW